jgi:hypothetical protein
MRQTCLKVSKFDPECLSESSLFYLLSLGVALDVVVTAEATAV